MLARGDVVQTLLEQGRPYEALLFGQKCSLFLIHFIFSQLQLPEITWQVFCITAALTST